MIDGCGVWVEWDGFLVEELEIVLGFFLFLILFLFLFLGYGEYRDSVSCCSSDARV